MRSVPRASTATGRNRHGGKAHAGRAEWVQADREAPSEEGSSQQIGQESHHYIHSVHKLLLSASEYLNERFHIAVKEFMIID